MRLLLDTNAYTAFHRGHPEVVAAVRNAERLVLSAIVVGELLVGFRGGTRYRQNLDLLEAFLDSPVVDFVPVTLVTADRFGLIATELRRAGTPIPSNDIWIAAHVLETGAQLLTLDSHFDLVRGLPRVPALS